MSPFTARAVARLVRRHGSHLAALNALLPVLESLRLVAHETLRGACRFERWFTVARELAKAVLP